MAFNTTLWSLRFAVARVACVSLISLIVSIAVGLETRPSSRQKAIRQLFNCRIELLTVFDCPPKAIGGYRGTRSITEQVNSHPILYDVL